MAEVDCQLVEVTVDAGNNGNGVYLFICQLKGVGFFKPNSSEWGDLQLFPTAQEKYQEIRKAILNKEPVLVQEEKRTKDLYTAG